MQARMREILRIARTAGADVIAFQELTPEGYAALEHDSWLNAEFALSSPTAAEAAQSTAHRGGLAPYGCLLAIRTHMNPTFRMARLTSQMKRTLVYADVNVPSSSWDRGGRVRIATVHLESLASQHIRAIQLDEIASVLGSGPSILCGDFNFCSRRNWGADYRGCSDGLVQPAPKHSLAEDGRGDLCPSTPPRREVLENDVLGVLLPHHLDLWQALRGADDPGFTFDTVANNMLEVMGHRYEQMRYDRVLTRLNGTRLTSESIQLVGTEPMAQAHAHQLLQDTGAGGGGTFHVATPSDVSRTYPSDHFGLLANFEYGIK
mmetsp:Transcript_22992/g.62397  ORF Transcript_22992/g.62397 Transcript_22992/m.62397 type:complete len:319 (-) Transcript_22992:172-1128(-)